jgi:hypothetical protein
VWVAGEWPADPFWLHPLRSGAFNEIFFFQFITEINNILLKP